MSANIKIGGNTVNGVNTIKVENADQVGQYVTFTNLTPVEETVTPTTATQEIIPQEGEMLSKVTVSPVTASIDANIVPQNIKSGVSILGVNGSYFVVNKLPQVADGTVTDITENDLSGATRIREYAFYSITTLHSISLPDTVTEIGSNAFQQCSGLVSVDLSSNLSSIGEYSFNKCTSLLSVSIPNGVTTIPRSAFGGCSNLTNLTIGNGVEYINREAFASCSKIASIEIPNSIIGIGQSAFNGCSSATYLSIGSGITNIGTEAFRGCTHLQSITVLATNPPTLAASNSFGETGSGPIYVPSESVDAYKSATNWSSLASRIQAIPS